MGNCHSVLQITPLVCSEGAALRVQADRIAAFEARVRTGKLPSYVSVQRDVPRFWISNVNVDSAEAIDDGRVAVYLVVKSGGKWGYDTAFNDVLTELAPFLEDATFFINDEYTSYIDEYAFARGALRIERVVAEGGSLSDYVLARLRHDPAKLGRYALQQAETWLDLREPDGALAWADRAVAAQPAAWNAHYVRARVLGDQAGHVAAIESLEKARACLGAYELEPWGDAADALNNVKPDADETIAHALKLIEAALGDRLAALGRIDDAFAAFDRSWSITPRRDNTGPMISKAVELIKLERHAEADACLVKAMSLATTRRVIGTIYYNRACIAARTGVTQRALHLLGSAIELVPGYKAMAREDDDFASLRDVPELQAMLR